MSTPNNTDYRTLAELVLAMQASTDGVGLLDIKASDLEAIYRVARRALAEDARAGAMTRDDAYELLEKHFGPQASINIHDTESRYWGDSTKTRSVIMRVLISVFSPTQPYQSFERPTMSEAVAAAMAHTEAYKEEGAL